MLTRWTSLLHRISFTGWQWIAAAALAAAVGPSFAKYGTLRFYDLLPFLSIAVFSMATYGELRHPTGAARTGTAIVSLLAAAATILVVVIGWILLAFGAAGP